MVDQTLHSATGPPLAIEVNGGNEPNEHDQYRQADETGGAGIRGHFLGLMQFGSTAGRGIAQTMMPALAHTARLCIVLSLGGASKFLWKIDS